MKRFLAWLAQLRANVADVRSTTSDTKQDTSSSLSGVTSEARRLLRIRAWRWRHYYLEAKRLQIEERRHQ
jgi:hypothetical protein